MGMDNPLCCSPCLGLFAMAGSAMPGLEFLSPGLGGQLILRILPIGILVPMAFLAMAMLGLWWAGKRRLSPTALALIGGTFLAFIIGSQGPLANHRSMEALTAITKALASAANNLRRLPF